MAAKKKTAAKKAPKKKKPYTLTEKGRANIVKAAKRRWREFRIAKRAAR